MNNIKFLQKGNLKQIKLLVDREVDPTIDDNYAFRWAAHFGHLEIVKFLASIPGVDPAAGNNFAICWAIEQSR